ncbi:protein of unknown function [Clostridium cavendishii DSM 21758]|uniref:DUF4179 domain-containing protein n=1 Tax=Clostridium cavendishii DSM 21758 TaxID=1121302 RepID=A0A1M6D8R1_9CLOT|nr:DUF4179 domain-containing protein [Clostridium cavendishii]SHI69637.1 protein of unknown function [Clostridium cavendishii DSM 21758]
MNKDFLSKQDDILIDELIKKEIKGELGKERISVRADLELEKTLKSLPKKSKVNKYGKKIVIAAGISFVTITSLGFMFPTVAKAVPVVGGIFQYLAKNTDDKVYYEKLDEFSQEIKQITESNGLKLEMDKLVLDGQGLVFTYTVEGDMDTLSKEQLGYGGKDRLPQVWDSKITVNNKEYKVDTFTRKNYIKDKNIYYVVTVIPYHFLSIDDLSKKFDFSWNISEMSGLKGQWIVKGTFDPKDFFKESFEKTLSDERNTTIGNIRLKKLMYSPMNVVIEGDVKPNESRPYGLRYDFNIYDDKGNLIKNDSYGMGYSNGYKPDYDRRFIGFALNSLKDKTKYLDIVPVKVENPDELEKNIPIPIKEEYLKGDKPIYDGKYGKITIYNFRQDKEYVYVKLKIQEGKEDALTLGQSILIANEDREGRRGTVLYPEDEQIKAYRNGDVCELKYSKGSFDANSQIKLYYRDVDKRYDEVRTEYKDERIRINLNK